MELFYKIHLLQIYVNYNASDYDQLFKDYCFNVVLKHGLLDKRSLRLNVNLIADFGKKRIMLS